LIAALSVAIALAVETGSPRTAQTSTSTETVVCDSEGFLKAAQDAESSRLSRRIDEVTFARMAAEPKTIVLDARSSEHWKQLRVRGSLNLPYTDFSASALERIIPSRDTRVLIYCRNNIRDTRRWAQHSDLHHPSYLRLHQCLGVERGRRSQRFTHQVRHQSGSMTTPTARTKANKTDAGNGSKAICRVSNVLRSPSPDPRRSPT
jgi:hypothetical protein